MLVNNFKGKCKACNAVVLPKAGVLERVGKRWQVWCQPCFNQSDHSGPEDRACGDRAYEDACAERVGF